MLWIIALCAAGLLGVLAYVGGKRFDTELKETLESIERHMGRAPDYRSIHHGKPEYQKIFAVYVPERKIYFGPRPGPYHDSNFYDADYIRSWKVEWDTGVSDNGNTYKRNYVLSMTVKDIGNPIIKLPCASDEKLAHQLAEAITQMFEGQEVAPMTSP